MTPERDTHFLTFPRSFYISESACGNVDISPEGRLSALLTGDLARVTCEACRKTTAFAAASQRRDRKA